MGGRSKSTRRAVQHEDKLQAGSWSSLLRLPLPMCHHPPGGPARPGPQPRLGSVLDEFTVPPQGAMFRGMMRPKVSGRPLKIKSSSNAFLYSLRIPVRKNFQKTRKLETFQAPCFGVLF
eukprot:5016989-Amphidinium_carterae.1